MKNTLFVQLLKKLPSNQLRKLVSFAESKYHNSHDATSKLISQIVSTAPKFSENQLDKRLIWKKVYPNKPFKELSYNNLVSDALRVSYDFLSLENWTAKQDEYYNNLAEALIDLGLYDQANRNLKRWRKTKEKQNLDSAEQQMGNYRWFEHQDQIAILQKRRYSDYLQQKNDALDQYYLQNKLQID